MLGWVPPTGKQSHPQPRLKLEPGQRVDLDAVYADPIVMQLLERWEGVRHYFPEVPPYAGGVMEWPGVDADGFAICYAEEQTVSAFKRWRTENPDA